jgi:UPF0755 protein
MARRGGGSFFLSMLWTALLLGMAGLALGVWELHRPGPATQTQSFLVEKGAGVSAIGADLKREGLIRSRHAFRLAAILYADGSSMKAGEYEVEAGEPLRAILEKIESGRSRLFALTIPEGRTSAEVIALIDADEHLTGETPPVPPEGAILPETYHFPRGMTRATLLKQMTDAREKVMAELWEKRASNIPVKSPEEALILASIVEKETGLAAERPQVAAVFTNRLNTGMRLESDPTVIYGLCKCSRLRDAAGKPRGIRRSEIDRPNPYNTYQIARLPLGPITNPGRDAIAAVLNPPQSESLFFVALDPFDPSKGHVFSKTYAEHSTAALRLRAAEQVAATSAAP